MNLTERFNRALGWIEKYSNVNGGIAVNSKDRSSYPEVSGYYIPTLLNWDQKERAYRYGEYLKRIQRPNGAWADHKGHLEYIFDSGQILKGLVVLAESDPSYLPHVERGCDWILSHVQPSGEILAPDVKGWGGVIPPAILLYAIEPIRRAGKLLNRPDYAPKVQLAVDFFLKQKDLTAFKPLSHFHAYVLEALVDLGYPERAQEGMDIVAKLQRPDGSVPAYPHVKWVCSTGLFQYACIWYKLGDSKRANAAFDYAVNLQNRSGGWYGSYGYFKKYFPWAEISWGVKYFLDAFHLKLKADFTEANPIDAYKRLSSSEWEKHYNPSLVDGLVKSLKLNDLSSQTEALINLSKIGESVLEIGSGSGATSLCLAMNGRKATALDFGESCLALTRLAANRLNCQVDTILADAESGMPFTDNQFDIVFQAGLLEHYEYAERVALLKTWGRVGKKMISIIPNAASLAYRVGKKRMEERGDWAYGKELPQYTLNSEFEAAGFRITKEYTIGAKHALDFLPRWHYLRIAMKLWLKNNRCEDNCGQGYLLVTVGEKI